MLYIGEQVGRHDGLGDTAVDVDIAVDPLEGTNLVATGQGGAITVLAASEKGGVCCCLLPGVTWRVARFCVAFDLSQFSRWPWPARPATRSISKHQEGRYTVPRPR